MRRRAMPFLAVVAGMLLMSCAATVKKPVSIPPDRSHFRLCTMQDLPRLYIQEFFREVPPGRLHGFTAAHPIAFYMFEPAGRMRFVASNDRSYKKKLFDDGLPDAQRKQVAAELIGLMRASDALPNAQVMTYELTSQGRLNMLTSGRITESYDCQVATETMKSPASSLTVAHKGDILLGSAGIHSTQGVFRRFHPVAVLYNSRQSSSKPSPL